MTLFRGRGTMAGTILSAIVILTFFGFVHFCLGRAFLLFLEEESRLAFVVLLILSFGFITTFRLASAVRHARAMRRRWVGVDEKGIAWSDGTHSLHVAWDEVEEVRVNFVRIRERIASYLTVSTRGGERFSLSHHFQGRIQETREGKPREHAVVEVEMTPFVLYLLKESAGLSEVEPYVWRRGESSVVVVDDRVPEETPAALQGGLKGVTPVQGVLAMLSLVLYTGMAWFSEHGWTSGLGIFVLLLAHELGHVWAMRRSGMKVRGIYFVPFLGAATVPSTLWKDRDAQAYTAISGPLWGAIASALLLVAFHLTGSRHSILLFLAGLNAVLNLFNLIPIAPLDGARVLASVAGSVSPSLGLGIGVGFILTTVGAALWIGGALLWVLAGIGVVFGTFEVLTQYFAAVEAEKVRVLGPPKDPQWIAEVARLGDMLSLQTSQEYAWIRTGGAPRRTGRWMRWQQVLACQAMRWERIPVYLGMYALVAGLLCWFSLPFLRAFVR